MLVIFVFFLRNEDIDMSVYLLYSFFVFRSFVFVYYFNYFVVFKFLVKINIEFEIVFKIVLIWGF